MTSLAGSAEGMRRAAELMAQAAEAVRDEAGALLAARPSRRRTSPRLRLRSSN